MFKLLSCASSTITTEYFCNKGSSNSSLSKLPSVQNTISVSADFNVSNRTETPTVPPKRDALRVDVFGKMRVPFSSSSSSSLAAISSHTLIATVCALARLGCVTHTIFRPGVVHFARLKYWQICVVFPHPVAPTTTTTWWCSRRYKTSRRCLRMGTVLVAFFFIVRRRRLLLLLPLSSVSSSSSSSFKAPRAERQRPPFFFQVSSKSSISSREKQKKTPISFLLIFIPNDQ